MKINRKRGAALLAGVGLALSAVVMFATDSASAFPTACSMQGGTKRAQVSVTPEDGSVCVRRATGGAAAVGTPSCHDVAFNNLGCSTVYTFTSNFTACSMQGGTRAAQVSISAEDGSVCVRRLSGGPAAQGTPSCHSVAFDNLGCTDVYTGPQ